MPSWKKFLLSAEELEALLKPHEDPARPVDHHFRL
jgi:hypothetical protein